MIKIAVFASGSGTNAENLIKYFKQSDIATVDLVLTNVKDAGVIARAKKQNIKVNYFTNDQFLKGDEIIDLLAKEQIDFIVLAGFLLLIPGKLIARYKKHIVNLHPALLPLHGGKGFYGKNVHEAVIRSGAILSGITIHHVNEKFDEGEIIFQAACHVNKTDNPSTLADKIHRLEYAYLPVVMEKIINSLPE